MNYPPIEGLPETTDTYEEFAVYVNSGRAEELFREFCRSLGRSCEVSWKDTHDA